MLVLGGYGGFGARVSLLLARRGYGVLVAGRTLSRAQTFCSAHPDLPLQAVRLDAADDLASDFRALQPWLVVDAAGPFQGNDYRIPEACIAQRCHYADLADARAFVCGISALDKRARQAGVSLVSGASSVPALTSAAADRLANGLDRVSLIDIALSASNRASGSGSVTAAILSYVGKPIRLWRGGRWQEAYGWQELEKLHFKVGGRPSIRRFVALCDVPDLSLLPERYPGRPAVRFRAGSEIALQNVGLWLLSWFVRWRWLHSLAGFARLGVAVQRLLQPLGGDRSAMSVLVKGWRADKPVQRSWTVFAEQGDGPWIPSLAVPLLADKLGAGELAPGARSAAGLFELSEFEASFRQFAISTGVREQEFTSLYARVMSDGFADLPPSVRQMHEVNGDLGAEGEAEVQRGGKLSNLVGRLLRLPPAAARVPVSIWMSEEAGEETWHRDFGGHRFSTRLTDRTGLLEEKFGVVRCAMELRNEPRGLSMHLRRWWLAGLPMPVRFGPRIRAHENDVSGVFNFDVEIRLPLLGPMIRYRGALSRRAGA